MARTSLLFPVFMVALVASGAIASANQPDLPRRGLRAFVDTYDEPVKAFVRSYLNSRVFYNETFGAPTSADQAAAQNLFNSVNETVVATRSRMGRKMLVSFLTHRLNLSSVSTSLANFSKNCKPPFEVGYVAVLEGPYLDYNGAVIACVDNLHADVWLFGAASSDTISFHRVEFWYSTEEPNLDFSDPARSLPSFDVMTMLMMVATGREVGIVKAPSSAMVCGAYDDFLNDVTKGVGTIVDALHELAQAFGSHSKTTIIGRRECLSFDSFNYNTTVSLIQCLDDDYYIPFITHYFAGVSKYVNNSRLVQELIDTEYAEGYNISYDGMHLTNVNDSPFWMIKFMKNHDRDNQCNNLAIIDYEGDLVVSKDLIYWEKSSSSWFGLKTKDEVYIQQVPHEITQQDIQAMILFNEMMSACSASIALGQNCTWPTLPACTGSEHGRLHDSHVVEAASAAQVMMELAAPLNVSVPSNWNSLVRNVETTTFGNNQSVTVTPSNIQSTAAKWPVPAPLRDKIVDMILSLWNVTEHDKFFGKSFGLSQTHANLTSVLVVFQPTSATTGSLWINGMLTVAQLIQQTSDQPSKHCWHCAKCVWIDKCCCRTDHHQVPRPFTASELATIADSLEQHQFVAWEGIGWRK